MCTAKSKTGDLRKVGYGGGTSERCQVTSGVPPPVPWIRLSVNPKSGSDCLSTILIKAMRTKTFWKSVQDVGSWTSTSHCQEGWEAPRSCVYQHEATGADTDVTHLHGLTHASESGTDVSGPHWNPPESLKRSLSGWEGAEGGPCSSPLSPCPAGAPGLEGVTILGL